MLLFHRSKEDSLSALGGARLCSAVDGGTRRKAAGCETESASVTLGMFVDVVAVVAVDVGTRVAMMTARIMGDNGYMAIDGYMARGRGNGKTTSIRLPPFQGIGISDHKSSRSRAPGPLSQPAVT